MDDLLQLDAGYGRKVEGTRDATDRTTAERGVRWRPVKARPLRAAAAQ